MNYDGGEGKIATLIKLLSDYSDTNVKQGDWGELSKGRSSANVILVKDRASEGVMNTMGGGKQWTHYTRIELYHLLKQNTYETTYTDHIADVETLVNKIEQYRHLNDSDIVVDADVITVTEPQRRWENDNGPYFIATNIIVEWIEMEDISYLD